MSTITKSIIASKIQTYPDEYDPDFPDVPIGDYVLDKMREHGDRVACVDSDTKRAFTYTEVICNTEALAAALQMKLNVQPRDMVAIVLPNCLEYPIAALAVTLVGATVTLINPNQNIAELRHCIKLTKPKVFIGNQHFLSSKFHQLFPSEMVCSVGHQPSFILVDSASNKSSKNNKNKHQLEDDDVISGTWTDLINAGRGKQIRPNRIVPKEDLAFVLFSSGTTGFPKGVAHTHANAMTARRIAAEVVAKRISFSPEDATLSCLPFFHTTGFNGLLESFYIGIRLVLLPRYSLRNMLTSIQQFKITSVVIVPAIMVQMAKNPVEREYDLSSLRLMRCGAAPLSHSTVETMQQKLGCFIIQSYGMTESTLVSHSNTIALQRDRSIGVVMPFCESIVVDVKTNEALGPNQEGEICVRGPLVMKGYVGNDEATRNTIDADGWLHTGDVGYYDEDGFFFITDRIKELIKYKGSQVAPSELEAILLSHPEIVDAGVAGVPDEEAGELPRAFVVKREGSTLTDDQITSFVADQVSTAKKLRGGVIFVNSIPKNASGKILRRELKKMATASKL